MTAECLTEMIREKLRADAEVDFLLVDGVELCWLDLRSVDMSADVDDPNNRDRGGLVFVVKKRF